MPLLIRPAGADDLAAINAIYNRYVLSSVCTYVTEPTSDADRAAWLTSRSERHPGVVAELDGAVVGFGALYPFRPQNGYLHTVENSLYVREDLHRRGIGKALLADLLDRAKSAGHHSVIAVVDSTQPISLALHRQAGFQQVALIKEAGRKFDRWLDVIYLQKLL